MQVPPKPPTKSGDSARQDAERAIEANRKETNPKPEDLPELLQGAADERAEKGQAPVTTKQFEQLLRMVESLTTTNGELRNRVLDLENVGGSRKLRRKAPLMLCPTCRQTIRAPNSNRGVCDGQHVVVMVAPKDRDFWPDFQSYIHNGVKYYGVCPVPVSCAEDILAGIERWVEYRKTLQRKRGVIRDMPDYRSTTAFKLVS